MKQYEAVIETLKSMGGVATQEQLYGNVFNISDCVWNTKTPFASIRRIVQQTQGIYKIRPGLYGLETMRKFIESRGIIIETDKNKYSDDIRLFNHTYYQGLLILIGNMRRMKTFVPRQDKNRKFFDGRRLGEIVSLCEQPNYSYNIL